jgi:hypothetical protein
MREGPGGSVVAGSGSLGPCTAPGIVKAGIESLADRTTAGGTMSAFRPDTPTSRGPSNGLAPLGSTIISTTRPSPTKPETAASILADSTTTG